jgi:hypothetical protein
VNEATLTRYLALKGEELYLTVAAGISAAQPTVRIMPVENGLVKK